MLYRWQEAGIRLSIRRLDSPEPAAPLTVARPRGLRSLLRRALATIGLRRNSAGGFGAIVPIAGGGGMG